MRPKRYKPLVDKLFYIISVPTLLLIAAATVLLAFSETAMLFVMIPIMGVSPQRKFYADSMLSLKNSLDHINIKYNTFDITSVSVVGNAELMAELEHKISAR